MNEKRILCTEVNGDCYYFREVTEPEPWLLEIVSQGCYCLANGGWEIITKDKCKNCIKKKYVGITREQAIYKMAKALCNMYYSACSECAFKDKPKECKSLLKNSDFYEQGEAVLDALLSQGE